MDLCFCKSNNNFFFLVVAAAGETLFCVTGHVCYWPDFFFSLLTEHSDFFLLSLCSLCCILGLRSEDSLCTSGLVCGCLQMALQTDTTLLMKKTREGKFDIVEHRAKRT